MRNLLRTDVIIIWVLYLLTFYEFLFPQSKVNSLISGAESVGGTYAALLAFAGLVAGRYLVRRPPSDATLMPARLDIKPSHIIQLFVLSTIVGFFHMFVSVDFDPLEVIRQFSLPRFSQAWSRGQYGGAYALLYELGMLIYLIPPISGLIFARPKEYKIWQKVLVAIVLAFTLYYGFSTGTRNILGTYVVTFGCAYFLSKPKMKLWQLIGLGGSALALSLVAMSFMLEFRTTGLSGFSFEKSDIENVYVDYNMVIVSKLVEAFPDQYDFLGLEIPFNALIRPIPRVLWPGKPEGLSVTMESVVGAAAQTSVSSTFVGESYMAAGFAGVLFFGLFFGALAEAWNRVGRHINSQFAQLLYVTGLVCAAITMRSMLWFLPMALPAFVLWLYGKYIRRGKVLRGAQLR